MKLEVSINNIQHVKKIEFSINLEERSLICITGKNGTGKTTLIKAIRNLVKADTFSQLSPSRSFLDTSEIAFKVDGKDIVYKYDKERKLLDSRDIIPKALRQGISVELPIPHGERFNFFQKISENDSGIRSQVIMKNYTTPTELIDFLNSIYATDKFDDLVVVTVKGIPYYVIVDADNYYLREDSFSSGEFFLINLYRRIISGYMAIFIDEIDISLDAAAQVQLVKWLRKFKDIYETTYVFTTHSLAMMKMLEPGELYYMENQADGTTAIQQRSYAFVKSTLFGFTGWDKYILTEDDVLKDFIEYLISKHCKNSFYLHKTIYVGGGTNTTDLMERNKTENFFSKTTNNVIAILDGDQRGSPHSKKANVYCIPFDSVEKELLARCLAGDFWNQTKLKALINDHQRLIDFVRGQNNSKKNILMGWYYRLVLMLKKSTATRRKLSVARGTPATAKDFKKAGKTLFAHLVRSECTRQDIFEFLIKKYWTEIQPLRHELEEFICIKNQEDFSIAPASDGIVADPISQTE